MLCCYNIIRNKNPDYLFACCKNINDSLSKPNDSHYTGTKQAYDYSYDGNGNLILDNNKAISAITYNYPQTGAGLPTCDCSLLILIER